MVYAIIKTTYGEWQQPQHRWYTNLQNLLPWSSLSNTKNLPSLLLSHHFSSSADSILYCLLGNTIFCGIWNNIMFRKWEVLTCKSHYTHTDWMRHHKRKNNDLKKIQYIKSREIWHGQHGGAISVYFPANVKCHLAALRHRLFKKQC